MKVVLSKNVRRKGRTIVAVCVIAVLMSVVGGMYYSSKHIGVVAAGPSEKQYEIRSGLLEKAMDRVGVCSVEDAVKVWSDGLKARSGAMQFSVMSKALKGQYAAQLDGTFPNWVTGISSPWADSYQIQKTENLGGDRRKVTISFSLATSSGPAGKYQAVLILNREGTFWRITAITTDEGLNPYTGFKPVS